MLSRHVGRVARQKRDPAWPFRRLAPALAAADISFCNLESPFSDRGPLVEKGMVFKAEPDMVAGLVLAGIDVVSTANNHARDGGSYGLEFTLGLLARNGIAAVGTALTPDLLREGTVLRRRGVRVGFLAYTYDQLNGNHSEVDERVAMMNIGRMRRDVEELRRKAEFVIVSMHAGQEYATEPHVTQTIFARAAIDAGARIVAGHHPHVVQPVEEYGQGVIFYSLGNLVFDQMHRQDTQRGVLAELTLEGARLTGYRLLPYRIEETAPVLD